MHLGGKLIVGLLTAFLGACATPDDLASYEVQFDRDKPFGIVSGYVVSQKVRGLPSCPADSICMDAVFELQLEETEMVAGSAGAPISTVWAVWHSGRTGTPRMAFIVQKAADGRLWSVSRGTTISDGRACFSAWEWEQHRKLLTSAGGKLVQDQVCVPVI
jgi:hypothetical protein